MRDDIYLFAADRGTETAHFLVEAADRGEAREKLGTRFDGFEDAECLGAPAEVMDLHNPDVVMLR